MRQLGPLDWRNVTPSLRDALHAVSTQKSALAVMLGISRRPIHHHPANVNAALPDPAKVAAWAEEAGVSALAVEVDPVFGGTLDDLKSFRLGSLPLLSRDLILTREQVYEARLAGADAVLLQAGALSTAELRTFLETAASTHMAAPVEISTRDELQAALNAGTRWLVVSAEQNAAPMEIPSFSALDLSRFDALEPFIPSSCTVVVRGPFADEANLEPLRGRADGVWIDARLLQGGDDPKRLSRLVDVAENGLPGSQ